jgi:16S rRNA (cytidine1402-2'-O)-methyltransferase
MRDCAPRASEEEADATPLEPGLYLVATPIGNLEDITLRALRTLKEVDRIACEDTRLTQKLLNHFGIRTPTISCHQHNEQARAAELLDLLKHGGRVAVVTDAGMPGISDPGTQLTRAALEAGIKVIPVPGASAALTALVASGLDTKRFLFAGFLASKTGARRKELAEIASSLEADRVLTLILYEAPHRILDTMEDIERTWGGDVRVVVARELTKRHEEFLRGSLAEVKAELMSRDRIRGEIVILIEARKVASAQQAVGSIAQRVAVLVHSHGLDERDALKRVARELGLSKSEAYRSLQQEKRSETSDEGLEIRVPARGGCPRSRL